MSFRFEKLEVWKQARAFVGQVYLLTKNFPKEERCSLVDQLRRAAMSIILNIAEGSDRKSDVEFIRFLRISLGSLNEVISGMYVALDLSYLTKDRFNEVYFDANQLTARINALVSSLKK